MTKPGELFSLKGKVAIVTGTSRGNGKTFAEALLEAGAQVHCFQRTKTKENSITHKNACTHVVDVTDTEGLKKEVAKVVKESGRIDILVNNAAITIGSPSESYKIEDWDKTLDTDLRAVFTISQLVATQMIKHKAGVIVNVTSINSETGFPGNPAYVAAKGGLKQLSKAFAFDWAKYGIRVNNLGLGYFQTDMTKKSFNDPVLNKQRSDHMLLGRWGGADDLVGPIIFLCSDASQYMTGQDLYIDGGWLAKGL
jgi:NAD(P)-dependent dehydrogenase (short-subunit alcohol dehydrogenase family)